MDVFNIWTKYDGKKITVTERDRLVYSEMENNLGIEDKENITLNQFKTRVLYICKKITEFWRKCQYKKEKFLLIDI